MGLLGAILPKVFGAAVGIFGANKARRQAKADAANKFIDLRAAAEAGGFNPLTALEATGGGGFGAYPSSAPPLASVELLTGAVQDGIDEIDGTAAMRRAKDRLELDLAKLRLDQARSGVAVYEPRRAVSSVGSVRAPVGGSPPVTVATNAAFSWPDFYMPGLSDMWANLGGNREVVRKPTENLGMMMQIENQFTPFGPIWVPGSDGEVMGWDEVLVSTAVGAPQVAGQAVISFGSAIGTFAKNKINGGVPLETVIAGTTFGKNFFNPKKRWPPAPNRSGQPSN